MAASKEVLTPVATVEETNLALEKAKGFWANYSKPIIYVGTAIILLAAGWLGYQKLIKEPKELKANESVFHAESLFDKMATSGFSKDSVNIVLNGGSLEGTTITGLLKVISNYDGTASANRARYMTGASYLQIGEFDKAIRYLKEFKGNGATQIESKALTMLGHAYAEKKQTAEAFDAYFLMAAAYAETTGKNKEAIELYKKLKDKYPKHISVSNGEIEKNLARLGEFN
jgi:tetratricopeptide (TPR) repeat protein